MKPGVEYQSNPPGGKGILLATQPPHNEQRPRKKSSFGCRSTLLTLLALGAIGTCSYSRLSTDTVTTTINGAESHKGKYLIYTDAGTFENTDAWYRGKFSSSDMHNEAVKLKGKKATITKYGWRMPLFSMYENVVELKEE
ncbi:MAG: DUF1523 family protein [Nanoarchaeota archaeon]|nr:DUF1523 family protein [Nanoarchaeota archaeon]